MIHDGSLCNCLTVKRLWFEIRLHPRVGWDNSPVTLMMSNAAENGWLDK